MANLVYIIRNNYRDGEFHSKQTSILGVFDTFPKAYRAAREKALEMKESCPNHKMELKTMPLNGSNYAGCSAYRFNFLEEKSEFQLQLMQGLIESWCYWPVYIQQESKISLRNLLIAGLIGTEGVIFADKKYEVVNGNLVVGNAPASAKDCEYLAHYIFYQESCNFGNEITCLTDKKDVVFKAARDMGNPLLHIVSSKDALSDMVKDKVLPDASSGELHPTTVSQLLEEIEAGFNELIALRAKIMHSIYPNCTT